MSEFSVLITGEIPALTEDKVYLHPESFPDRFTISMHMLAFVLDESDVKKTMEEMRRWIRKRKQTGASARDAKGN